MKVENSQITNYMLSLYPEFKNYDELEKFLIGNCSLSGDFLINEFRKECKEDDAENILKNECYEKTLSILKENNLRFSSYFAAFISEKYPEIYSAAARCGLTDDVESLVSDIICKMYSNLYNIGIRVLVFELEIAKEQGMLIGNTPEERFDFFSEKLLTDEQYISQLHNEYKLMYSIITKSVEQTADFVKDILANTSENIDEIKDKFFFGKDPGSLLYVNFSIGDAHKDGRSVTVLVFESGNVVYKPHSLESDQAFQTLIDHMNSMIDKKYRLRKIRIICCDGYGFTEFIEHSEVKDKEELKLFYKKSGILMALLYACNMSDCHFENIIASGPDPVIIDTETLFHCILPDVLHLDDKNCAYLNIKNYINKSVCGIGLLPAYINIKGKNNEKKNFSIGGMSGSAAQESPFFGYDLNNIDSDNMQMVKCAINVESSNNSPVLDGKEAEPREFSSEIVWGFQTAYRCIMNNKESFIKKVVSLFDHTYNRIVLKATMVYASLLNIATHPDFMRSEVFARFLFSRTGFIKTNINLNEYETASLISRCVPIYYTNFSEKYVVNGNGTVYENALDNSPKEEFIEKINNFSETDLSVQIHFIKSSYYVSDDDHDYCKISFYNSSAKKENTEQLLEASVRIGDYLIEQRSIPGINNRGRKERFFFGCSIERCDNDDYTNCISDIELYNGSCGMALYLYYLGKVSGEKRFIDASYETLEPVMRVMESGTFNYQNNTGAFTGISGSFYVLSKISENDNDNELRDFISDKLHYIYEFAVKESSRIDLISGTSGGFAVLLNIIRNTTYEKLKKTALDEAEKCFELIYESVYKNEELFFELCGFSHGISGALPYIYEYYLISHNEKALTLFRDLLEYERREFRAKCDGKITGWYSAMDKKNFMTSWCHGTAGILLEKSMLKDLGYHDDELDEELEAAATLVKNDCIGTAVSYCHGDLGNIFILKMYAESVKDENLISSCKSVFADLYEKYLDGIEINEKVLCQKYTGLMIGLTGVGYACLNEVDSSLPSFLKLE